MHRLLQEHLQYTMGLLVDESGNTLDTTTAGQTMDGGLGDTLDVVSQHLCLLAPPFPSPFPFNHCQTLSNDWKWDVWTSSHKSRMASPSHCQPLYTPTGTDLQRAPPKCADLVKAPPPVAALLWLAGLSCRGHVTYIPLSLHRFYSRQLSATWLLSDSKNLIG